MIVKPIESSLCFSAKKNKNNELTLILYEQEMPELKEQDGIITHVGLDNDGLLNVQGVLSEEVIVYKLPYNEEIIKLISRYELEYVSLFLSKDENLKDLSLIFSGFLRLYNQ